jgi:hypothetical protein
VYPSRGCEETLLKEMLVRNFTQVGRRSLAGMRSSTYSHHAVDSNCEFHGNRESSERLVAAGGGWKTNLVLITAAISTYTGMQRQGEGSAPKQVQVFSEVYYVL